LDFIVFLDLPDSKTVAGISPDSIHSEALRVGITLLCWGVIGKGKAYGFIRETGRVV